MKTRILFNYFYSHVAQHGDLFVVLKYLFQYLQHFYTDLRVIHEQLFTIFVNDTYSFVVQNYYTEHGW